MRVNDSVPLDWRGEVISHDLPVVTSDIAEIRARLDRVDLAGHAHDAPSYEVLPQDSHAIEARQQQTAKLNAAAIPRVVMAPRLVTY